MKQDIKISKLIVALLIITALIGAAVIIWVSYLPKTTSVENSTTSSSTTDQSTEATNAETEESESAEAEEIDSEVGQLDAIIGSVDDSSIEDEGYTESQLGIE